MFECVILNIHSNKKTPYTVRKVIAGVYGFPFQNADTALHFHQEVRYGTQNLQNISSGYAFSLIGISPPPGSPAGALLSCDGFFSLDLGRDASIIISSACHRSSRMRRDVKD